MFEKLSKRLSKHIGVKITLLVALIIIVSIATYGILIFASVTANTNDTMSKTMKESAKDKADLLSTELTNAKENAQNIAKSIVLRNLDENETRQMLKSQEDAIKGINMEIDNVSVIIEENTETSLDSERASKELSDQAERLKTMIGSFKLKKYDDQLIEEFDIKDSKTDDDYVETITDSVNNKYGI